MNLKINKARREAPRRNVMESKHTEAAPDRRAEDGGALAPVRSPEGGGGLGPFGSPK